MQRRSKAAADQKAAEKAAAAKPAEPRKRWRAASDGPGGGYFSAIVGARRHVMNVVDQLAWMQGVQHFQATEGRQAEGPRRVHEEDRRADWKSICRYRGRDRSSCTIRMAKRRRVRPAVRRRERAGCTAPAPARRRPDQRRLEVACATQSRHERACTAAVATRCRTGRDRHCSSTPRLRVAISQHRLSVRPGS